MSDLKAPSQTVLDKIWHKEYAECPIFGQQWKQATESGENWPDGIRLHNGKMYWKYKLCVPTGLGEREW